MAIELTEENCAAYLAARGESGGGKFRARELGGGISNRVLWIESAGRRFVLKQSLDRLRVADEWVADRSRIFREVDSLRDAARILPAGAVPEVLWDDRPNYLFAMSAAEPEARTWKDELLEGEFRPSTAAAVGALLGLLIRDTWGGPEFQQRYGDLTTFHQLRVDPYYRAIARRHPDLAAPIQELIAESTARQVCLVHGDWSPKNFLVRGDSAPMVIDFEVVHYGDPSFDTAFCINHFLLKCFRRPADTGRLIELALVFYTWAAGLLPPEALGWFERATARHLGCLLLARIDGKSPVEYLAEETVRERVRRTARRIILERPDDLGWCYQWVAEEVAPR